MKKKTILTLAAVATALGLTACGSQNDETAQLKEQVAQLEQQVEDLQSESPASDTQDVSAPPAEDSAAAEDTSDQNTPSASTEDTQQKKRGEHPESLCIVRSGARSGTADQRYHSHWICSGTAGTIL